MKNRKVYMNGEEVFLLGSALKIGEKAPDFVLTGAQLQPVTLKDFKGKVIILSCVPSVDTPTCSLETRRFNEEAAALGPNVVIITVSKDLPFAQARWCAANGVKNIVMLSDYKNQGFAARYGVLMEGLDLLTRALFVLDKQGIIQYIQFVEEVSHEPDYQDVLEQARELLK